MKRRTFFGLSALMLVNKPSVAHHTSFDTQKLPRVCNELLCYFDHKLDAAAVGRNYLLNNPVDQELPKLLAQAGVGQLDQQAIPQFEAQRRRDFAGSNTVVMDGWVLSKAEISLCAIASLAQTQA